ncbi:splicing factor, arginine/serine-rich 19-like [Amphiprion ocellaris]|uniref:splicing factor, arginine/serine-rich 19-like n=1 Tax=Amphiprion ocellaris TaxID=80972 RepID=UPI00241171CE|nr:splicing factor, arginine/serine-rich 19-like [Amphiprion ocellaris]
MQSTVQVLQASTDFQVHRAPSTSTDPSAPQTSESASSPLVPHGPEVRPLPPGRIKRFVTSRCSTSRSSSTSSSSSSGRSRTRTRNRSRSSQRSCPNGGQRERLKGGRRRVSVRREKRRKRT